MTTTKTSTIETPELNIREIGQAAGLIDGRLELYERYVSQRFPGRHPNYISEWANRFSDGYEFVASDSAGQAMLLRMYQGSKP